MALPPFQRLIDDHGDAVHRYLVVAVGPHDADDCWQETMLAALRAYPELRHGRNLRGWLFTIAHRKAVDTGRARRRVTPIGVPPDRAALAPDGVPQPELWNSVRGLPPKQQEAVLRRYVADLPYADIGAAMGCSPEAARRSVFEGLRKLREELV